MQTHDYPTGPHCHHVFDMELFREVVVTEVDVAVRHLCSERNIRPDSIDQHLWVDAIMHRIAIALTQDCYADMLRPSEIDARIQDEIDHLLERESGKIRPMDIGSIFTPAHGLLRLPRHAGVLWRKIFEKHIE